MLDFNIFITKFKEKNWQNQMQILKLISNNFCCAWLIGIAGVSSAVTNFGVFLISFEHIMLGSTGGTTFTGCAGIFGGEDFINLKQALFTVAKSLL